VKEITGVDAALPQFEALGAQVVGVSADHVATLEAFTKEHNVKHPLLGDFRRQVLPAWGAMVTDEKSPIFRYAKRAYFVLDRNGIVRYAKVMENPLDLLSAEEILKVVMEASAS
jgi:peroxiredoxin